jgi:hypothetical protein
VTTIHLNTIDDPTPGPGLSIAFNIEPAPACDEGQVGSYLQEVNPGSVGETDIPFNPGLAIPAGDALFALTFNGLDAGVSVTGYTVPSSEVPRARSTAFLPGCGRSDEDMVLRLCDRAGR